MTTTEMLTDEKLAVLAKDYREASQLTLPIVEMLAQAGIEIPKRSTFMALLIIAYGLLRSAMEGDVELSEMPKTFAGIAEMIGKVSESVAAEAELDPQLQAKATAMGERLLAVVKKAQVKH